MLDVVGFHPHMIRWCSLHTVNLGPLIWTAAGAMVILMEKATRGSYKFVL